MLKYVNIIFLLISIVQSKATFGIEIDVVLAKYQKSQPIQMKFSKTIKSDFSKPKEFVGTLTISGEKFYLENTKPDINKIIVDGNFIWNIQYPPAEFGGNPQYGRKKINSSKDSDLMFVILNDPKKFFQKFEVVKNTSSENTTLIDLKNKTPSDFKNLRITLDNKSKVIEKIQYNDDLENEVTIALSQIEFKVKISKDLFKIKIPKNTQVIEL